MILQQSALDDWFLRQDILDQLMSQDEDASEAERYADRIMRIAQEDSAEHQVLSDPFDRSVALVLSLVKEEGMDPWNIDLSAFLKLFTQRVRKEASGLDLPACGRLIRMSWEVLTQQASTLFDRVIALDVDDEDDFIDFGWESEYDDEVAAGDQSTEAYNIAYTISDDLSISYGSEELEFGVQSASQVAAEFERIKLTYTTGGMTLTASQSTGDNIDYSTTATKDQEVWALGATFAF